MKGRADILSILREYRPEMSHRFSVGRIGLFGSFARESPGPGSDVDILVELLEPTFDHYMDLKFFLEGLLDSPVDLVLYDTLKPRLKPIIDKEVVYA